MSGTTILKKYLPFFFFLVVVVICQCCILMSHAPFLAYINDKVSGFSLLFKPTVAQSNLARPVHVLLLSYARTGSSFVGDLLQSYPDAFYHFEPLHFLSLSVLNSSYSEARQVLSKLFQCKVSQLPGFLSWQKNHKHFMKLQRNPRFWKACSSLNTCFNSTFIDKYCSQHDIVIIKTIRIGLREAARLFTTNPELNLKIIYLARDPRGTLNSRSQNPVKLWCKADPKCLYSKQFCSLLEDDSQIACDLLSRRSNDFAILRYEDLSREPFATAKHLSKMLGIPNMTEMESFLRSHTATSLSPSKVVDGVVFSYSTFRNSVITSMKWRQEMPFVRAVRIQKECAKILHWLGYHQYTTSGALKSNVNFDKKLDTSLVSYCADLQ